MYNTTFPVRMDSNGLRPVFFLGNEGGNCSYNCTFCDIGKSSPVTSQYNIELFDHLYLQYKESVFGPNHPLIYNRGNITDTNAFSGKTLEHILKTFDSTENIQFLSINSREKEVTRELLTYIFKKKLKFPIHFIIGIESFSSNLPKTIGKSTQGELERLIKKLSAFNLLKPEYLNYQFGIDVGLLFLPELYFDDKFTREYKSEEIKRGFLSDIEHILQLSDDLTPIEINIHPYYQIESLPFKNAEIEQLISFLPDIKKLINKYNENKKFKSHAFIGFRPTYTTDNKVNQVIDKWTAIIDSFNTTNVL
jgi:hypothetical protein